MADKGSLSKEDNGSDTILVFQSPGRKEWVNKKPLSSDSPRSCNGIVSRSWERTGRKREEFDITNAVQCYPGQDQKTKRDLPPDPKAVEQCLYCLEKEILSKKYKIVIAFGKTAEKSVNRIVEKHNLDTIVINSKHPVAGVIKRDIDNLWTKKQ